MGAVWIPKIESNLPLEGAYLRIERAKAAGQRLGRSSSLNEEQQITVLERINAGISNSFIAREFKTTRQIILWVKQGRNNIDTKVIRHEGLPCAKDRLPLLFGKGNAEICRSAG
ncbi:MAG: helix-turn-helix domain-containing protein [Klebsiella aerogenes]|nr:helix-turn-helix domain-containing protein [Klebsiella aerogenes]